MPAELEVISDLFCLSLRDVQMIVLGFELVQFRPMDLDCVNNVNVHADVIR